MAEDQGDMLVLTTEIVSSYLGNNSHVKSDDIPEIIRSVRSALRESSAELAVAVEETPKLGKREVSKSIQPGGLVSFVDGKSYKTLKRHLARHGMDIKAYRERYGLPSDYPSVAPSYSAARSEMAKKLGLGERGKAAAAKAAGASRKPKAAPEA